jgi:hypothetical protein
MLRNLDTIYYKPDLVRISQLKLISERTFFGTKEVVLVSMATDEMIRLVSMYPEVWFMDTTAGE